MVILYTKVKMNKRNNKILINAAPIGKDLLKIGARDPKVANIDDTLVYLRNGRRYPESTSNTEYFATLLKSFVVKLKLLKKSSDFLLLGVTNITFMLIFKKSSKFYYVQTVKVVNSKDVSG